MKEEQRPRPWTAGILLGLLAALLLCLPLRTAAAGAPRTVVPLGRAVGIKLFSDGVMVVGFSEVDSGGKSGIPARDCGLKEGDIITHINQTEVDTIAQVQQALQAASGERMSIRATRGEKELQLTARAVRCSADGQYKLGAWIRDSMAGIGTMTYYDPASGTFGALGHGISDVDTARLMPMESGSILYAEIADVRRGESGKPGELHGRFQLSRTLGSLYANTGCGVFGLLSGDDLADGLPVLEVAQHSQVRTGPAQILTNIADDRVGCYQVEIERVYPAADGMTRNLLLRVTDPELLEATGGIVQGMSGSPILQNGKLVGAVTHVLVNDPTRGYGIFIENMIEAAE